MNQKQASITNLMTLSHDSAHGTTFCYVGIDFSDNIRAKLDRVHTLDRISVA